MWMPSFMQVSFQLQGFSCPRRCPDLVLATPPQRWPGGQSGAQTMRNRRHRSSPIERLRLAIDCLPLATRRAMLEGVQAQERIIVGAYTDGAGGGCPMLCAHPRRRRPALYSLAQVAGPLAPCPGG